MAAEIKATTEKALYKVVNIKHWPKWENRETIWDVVKFTREIHPKAQSTATEEKRREKPPKNPILCTENCLSK